MSSCRKLTIVVVGTALVVTTSARQISAQAGFALESRIVLSRSLEDAAKNVATNVVTNADNNAVDAQPVQDKWHPADSDSLVMRAINRRSLQLADSTLLSYQADAHGFLAFLAQFGEGLIIPPKVVQSEELALSIAWWQPGRSAQRLVGRRDTTLLPSAVGYYRDRYAVVLDNLPDRIRLGDGKDVRDIPHPLAQQASSLYEYAVGDSLSIGIPGRTILVDEVRFRPRDASVAAAVGSVYLDRETAAVVRISMTFTRAAILDKRIETLVLTLENGLVNGRYWLPRRQEVEVSRGSTWFDIPARGIVRGRWEVSNYTVNEQIPAPVMLMPRWSSVPFDSLGQHRFEGRVVDVLPPEIQIASSEDVTRARQQAQTAVQAAMLSRPTAAAVSGRGISDFARFNRTEGLALGIGGTHRSSEGLQLSGRLRYGFSDRQLRGQFAIGKTSAFSRAPRYQLFIERDLRDLIFAERAGVTNSLAAALFGSDYSMPVETKSAGLMFKLGEDSRFEWRLAAEHDNPVGVHASPISRSFSPGLSAWTISGGRMAIGGTGGWVSEENNGTRGLWKVQLGAGVYNGEVQDVPADIVCCVYLPRKVKPVVVRAQGLLQITHQLSERLSVFLQTSGGVAGGRDIPPQWMIFAGGPWSAPGYDAQRFGARAQLSQRLELRTQVPFPSIPVPVAHIGSTPPHVTLAPFVQALATGNGSIVKPTVSGIYPTAGIGVLFFYDLLRVDVARGLRGGNWRFAIDIDRSFWSIL